MSPSQKLSIRKQCALLGVNRSSYYYEEKPEKPENIQIMHLMDKHILKEPTAGVLTMKGMLLDHGIAASAGRVRRLMRKAGIKAIYPRKNLTKSGVKEYIYPYLLRNLEITYVNQVWEIDITYVPMKNGFMYLTAIIDVYSRYIVGWGLSNTLDVESVMDVVREAVRVHGPPKILNSDQGCQFTSYAYTYYLKKHNIQISMDGKGRALDNIFIERFWRTIKYQHIYLFAQDNGLDLYKGIKDWLSRYHQRRHQGVEDRKPEKLFKEK